MSKKLRLQQTRAGPGNLDANAEEEEEKFRKWYLDGPTEVTKRILEVDRKKNKWQKYAW
jgi:hypothetical protein